MHTFFPLRILTLIIVAVLYFSVRPALAQNSGRFDEAKRLGFIYLKDGKFDKAAGKLEEVWEMQNPPDAAVAEALAIAYLNGSDRESQPDLPQKAFDLMEKAIAGGGQATLLVQHSHERLGAIQGSTLTKYCSGRLSVKPGTLIFVAEAGEHPGEHSFELTPADLKDMGLNLDSSRGMFHIKTPKKGTYNFVPKSGAKQDSEFFLSLIRKNLQN